MAGKTWRPCSLDLFSLPQSWPWFHADALKNLIETQGRNCVGREHDTNSCFKKKNKSGNDRGGGKDGSKVTCSPEKFRAYASETGESAGEQDLEEDVVSVIIDENNAEHHLQR